MTIPHVPELLVILLIVLLIFGAGKLPDVAKSMGSSIKEFRRGVQIEESASDAPSATSSEAETEKSSVSATD